MWEWSPSYCETDKHPSLNKGDIKYVPFLLNGVLNVFQFKITSIVEDIYAPKYEFKDFRVKGYILINKIIKFSIFNHEFIINSSFFKNDSIIELSDNLMSDSEIEAISKFFNCYDNVSKIFSNELYNPKIKSLIEFAKKDTKHNFSSSHFPSALNQIY